MEKVKNILIDTDIGDDVDDALAIAFAMCSPEVRIQAVTTVFKNTGKRAELVQALLKVYGNSGIPVYDAGNYVTGKYIYDGRRVWKDRA